MGYYGLLSAAYGHRVIAFEPQPHCQLWILSSVLMSGFADRYTLVKGMVGVNTSHSVLLDPRTGCWSTWPIDQWGTKRLGPPLPKRRIPTVSLDEKIDEMLSPKDKIRLLKIDAEGAEVLVLRSAKKLIASKRIQNFIIEWSNRSVRFFGVGLNDTIAQTDFLYDLGYYGQCYSGTFHVYAPLSRQEMHEVFERLYGADYDAFFDCWYFLPDEYAHLPIGYNQPPEYWRYDPFMDLKVGAKSYNIPPIEQI